MIDANYKPTKKYWLKDSITKNYCSKDSITKECLKKDILVMSSYIKNNKRTFTGEEINYYKGQLDMLHYLYVKYF